MVIPGAGSDLTDLLGTNVRYDLIIDDATEAMDVEISDVGVGRNVFIYGTSASDFIRAVGLRAASLIQVFTETSNDYVQISGQTPRLDIFAGAGSDDVRVQSMNATRTNIYLDAGFDRLTISDSDVSQVYAYGGAENDVFRINTSFVDLANIYGDGGTDTFARSGSTITKLNLYSVEVK